MMNQTIPTKLECFYILQMLESQLINYSYTFPWADKIIESLEIAPAWLCDVATKKYMGDQCKAIRKYTYSEPFEHFPNDRYKFYVGCLWLRYERREISWATYLHLVGKHLDSVNDDWRCEIPYHYLNVFEEAYFTEESEKSTKDAYFKEQDVFPWRELAYTKYSPLRKLKEKNKSS